MHIYIYIYIYMYIYVVDQVGRRIPAGGDQNLTPPALGSHW